MNICLAHSQRHHACHLFYGIQQATENCEFFAAFYPKGIGWVISKIPNKYGRKASGFYHELIDSNKVISPAWAQLSKVRSVYYGNLNVEKEFDVWVSEKIKKGKINPDVLIALQDYMPRTVEAAWRFGAKIWSDQILNSSTETIERINRHCSEFGLEIIKHSEACNNDILTIADVVTSPSAFVDGGLNGRLNDKAETYRVPYGVDTKMFCLNSEKREKDSVLRIAVRGNSVRKGGHLFLEALMSSAQVFLTESRKKKIEVFFVGAVSAELSGVLERSKNIDYCNIYDGNVSHVDLPGLFHKCDFLIMPTLAEGMSLIIPEALACGLPVLSTKYCGVDYLREGYNGVLCDDNVESIAEGVVRIIRLIMSDKDIKIKARESAEMHDWGAYSNGVTNVYKQIIKF